MLTDEQRQIIEAEEQLRHEVRKRLDAENPPPPPPPPPPPGQVIISQCKTVNISYQIVTIPFRQLLAEWPFHFTWCWAVPNDQVPRGQRITYFSATADPPRSYHSFMSISTDAPSHTDQYVTYAAASSYDGIYSTWSNINFSWCSGGAVINPPCRTFRPIVRGLFMEFGQYTFRESFLG